MVDAIHEIINAVRKSPNYPVEFKIKMVELSHRPDP
ncbi:hypothetical protein BANRA_00011 [Escherichia coli]|nr:hypothetical protein BANRA_00011 [Escherichia coli]